MIYLYHTVTCSQDIIEKLEQQLTDMENIPTLHSKDDIVAELEERRRLDDDNNDNSGIENDTLLRIKMTEFQDLLETHLDKRP